MSSSSGANLVAFNPSDPVQAQFLSALALGETGGSSFASTEGTGGVNLAGDTSVDPTGFLEWQGEGGSTAEGLFQFTQTTWDQVAGQLGITSMTPGNQEEAAWTYAEQTYAAKTGGSLEGALQTGNYSSIQSALQGVWTSVTGNQAAPQGLAADLAAGNGAQIPNVSSNTASTASNAAGTTASSSGGLWGNIENFFVRFGLIAIGGVIVVVALWQLLSSQTSIPSPGETVHAAGRTVAEIA